MVSMLRRLILLTVGFTTTAQAMLEVKTDKTQSQLGEAIVLQIKSSEDLGGLDLSPLTKNFQLASQTLNQSASQGRQDYFLEVTLYPLRSGVLNIPRLVLGTQRTRALSVRIAPANVSIRAWFPPRMPIAREATMLHLEIRDDGSVSWDTPIQIDAPYTVIRALPESTREETRDGIKQNVHLFRWRILPLKEGSVTVNFGMLDAHRYAQRLRFPIGNISLNVRPTPAYLPLNLPIGRPYIRMDPRLQHLNANKLQSWNIYIHAPGLSAEGLQSLLQFGKSEGIVFYPPSITPAMLDNDEYLRLSLTYNVDRSARAFPEIRLPYFDLDTQRIEALTFPASPLYVRDPAREHMLAWALAIFTLGVMSMVSWVSWKYWQRRKTKQKWLTQIGAAQTPAELYAQLTKYSPWQVRTLRHLPAALTLDPNAYTELDALRFGRMEINRFPALKAKLLQGIAKTYNTLYPQHFLHS